MAGLIFRAAAPFHWAGTVYETGDAIDSTGWTDEAIRTFTRRCPVYVDQSGTAGTGGTGGPETDPIATAQVTTERTRAQAAETANSSALSTHELATPAHSAAGVSLSPSGLAIVTGTNVQSAVAQLDAWAGARPTNEAGTLAALPANGARPNGSTYLATDQYGGTPYRMVAGAWVQAGAGVTQVSGQIIAGPAQLTASFDVKAVSTVLTDVPGMSVAVPASARPVLLRAKFEVQANSGTAAANSAMTIRAVIADAANNNLAEDPVTFVQVAAAAVIYTGTITLELYLPAPVAAATYKIRASTTVAIPANWTSAFLLPGNGISVGVADNFYAQAA